MTKQIEKSKNEPKDDLAVVGVPAGASGTNDDLQGMVEIKVNEKQKPDDNGEEEKKDGAPDEAKETN